LAVATTPQDLTYLMSRIGGGDRSALRQLYDATSAKLFGVCLRILSDREEAEDVLQEVFVTVWRRADRFDATRASVMTWVSTIARNRSIDRLRARGPLAYAEPVEEMEIADKAPGAEALMVVAGEDKAGAVGLALAGANPVQVPAAGPRGTSRTLWLIDENAASRVPRQLVRKDAAGA